MQAACSDDELLGDQPCHEAKSTEPAAAAGAGEKSGKDKSKAKGKAKGKAQGKRKAGKSATQRGDSSRSSGGTKKKVVLKMQRALPHKSSQPRLPSGPGQVQGLQQVHPTLQTVVP